MSLEEDIAETQRVLQPLIPKPVLKDNLLTKPPFRFVHDVVSAVTKATGLAENLYADRPELMNAKEIKEKQDKLDYLDRVILFVGNWHGRPCDIKSGKVVAGVEPDRTNRFFVDLANAARECNPAANSAVVERTLAGQQPDPAFARGESGGGAKDEGASAKEQPPEAKDSDAPGPAAAQAKPPPSRGGGQRTGGAAAKEESAPRSDGLDVMGPESTPSFEAFVEQCTGGVDDTIKLVGELISKPKMTAKLLEKPPFRFLHDVFSAVCSATGFGEGLLDDSEKDAKELSKASKEAKVAFLEKIKSVVGFSLNTMVEARPAKIVAGLEPENTNRLLQLLAIAAKHCPESSKAVAMARGEEVPAQAASASSSSSSAEPSAAAAAPSHAPAKDEPPQAAHPEPAQSKSQAPAAAPGKDGAPSSAAMAKEDGGGTRSDMGAPSSAAVGGDSTAEDKAGDGGGGGGGGDDAFNGDDGEPKRSMRPTTARRRPPKVKDNVKAVEATAGGGGGGGGGGGQAGVGGGAGGQEPSSAAAAKPSSTIMVDGGDDAADSDDEDGAKGEGSSGSGGAFGVVADTAEGASKLVRDIEDEARGASGGSEGAAEAKDDGSKGIRLGRIKKTAELGKGANGALGAKKSMSSWSEQDIEALRFSVQRLCQATNPLGKCMDFVHEDLGAMSKEHEKWTQEFRVKADQLDREKLITEQAIAPLQAQLRDLDEQLRESASKIAATKAKVTKNDARFDQILQVAVQM